MTTSLRLRTEETLVLSEDSRLIGNDGLTYMERSSAAQRFAQGAGAPMSAAEVSSVVAWLNAKRAARVA